MSEKKKWSKKKKITVIVLSIVLFLFVVLLSGGLVAHHIWYAPADYQIVSSADFAKENTKIIAHRGFRGVAPENTLPAFDEAGKASFWGAECDVYRTSDGVWVIDHDGFTYRMMDFTKKVEECTYDELMEHNINNGVNIDQYQDLKICTLEDYLKTCDQYNMVAVIELKSKNDTEHYNEIVDMVAKYDVDVVYISFVENDLIEMRKLTDAPMYYLCHTIDDEAILIAQQIGNCGIDFNAGKKANFENDSEMIKKAQEKGLSLGAWTVDNPELMKQCLELGIEYITTNCITY